MPDPCANTPCSSTNTYTLDVPGDPHLTIAQCDCVTITCSSSQGFTWCYLDPDNVFNGNFLAPGSYDAGTYGPYQAVNNGTVSYKGKEGKGKSCKFQSSEEPSPADEVIHTISVGSTGK